MNGYRLRTGLPRLLRELDSMNAAGREQRLAQLPHMIEEDRLHIPLERDELLTERDRRGGILEFAARLRRANTELLGKHEVRHLMVPDRDRANAAVVAELEALAMPEPDDPPLAVVLSGPNSTGKSLLAAWLVVRLLGHECRIETTTERLSGIVRGGVYGPPPALTLSGTRLFATYEHQVVTRPSAAEVAVMRDPDLLREIQRGYDDKDAPSEGDQIRRLAASRVVIIEDLGWRHGGKPDFPRRVWSDFLDQRESARGTATIISTNLTQEDEFVDHLDMRGWERLRGMLRSNGGLFDLRGQSRRVGGQAA